MSHDKNEKLLDKLLIFMAQEIEKRKTDIGALQFNFQPSETKQYVRHPDEVIPEGDDLVAFKKYASIKNTEDVLHIVNLAINRDYVSRPFLNSRYTVRLDKRGYGRAVSVRNTIPKARKILKQTFVWLIVTAATAVVGLLIEKVWF